MCCFSFLLALLSALTKNKANSYIIKYLKIKVGWVILHNATQTPQDQLQNYLILILVSCQSLHNPHHPLH